MILAPWHGRKRARQPRIGEAASTAPAGRPAKPVLLSHTSGMAETTPSQRPDSAAVYFRRRVVVLVSSMSVLAGITWSAAALLGGTAPAGRAAASRPQLPAAAFSQASSAGTASSGLQNDVAADSRQVVPVRSAGRTCPVADVVVTLSATQHSYSAWQQPEFVVDVVSWASYPCSLDLGSGHVLLQISAGPAQVWTSADCAEGLASAPATLRHSVPAVLAMTWDEQYSSAGCPVPGPAVPAGSYTARATDGSALSNDVTFTLT